MHPSQPGFEEELDLKGICSFGAATSTLIGFGEVLTGSQWVVLEPLGKTFLSGALAFAFSAHLIFGAAMGFLAYSVTRLLRAKRDGSRATPWVITAGLCLLVPTQSLWQPALQRWPPRARDVIALAAIGVFIFVAARSKRLVGALPMARWLSRYVVLASVAVTAVLTLVSALARPGLDRPTRPDVVLISLDTVRADHLELYGYSRITAPKLSHFAGGSVVFDRAYALEPWTLPSHVTMMTSLAPLRHNVITPTSRLDESHDTLAERLRDAGYFTGAFVSLEPDSFVGSSRGLAKGFDLYHHAPHWGTRTLGTSLLELVNHFVWERRWGHAKDLTQAALDFLASPPRRPFFLFLHYFDAHSDTDRMPYESSESDVVSVAGSHESHFPGCGDEDLCATRYLYSFGPCPGETPSTSLSLEEIHDIVSHYDAGILEMDRELGPLLEKLASDERYRGALVVITSDHGEAFLEHGRFQHTQLYESLLRVPLVVRMPNGTHRGLRIHAPVQHTDLAPSILELAGIEPFARTDGRSLLPLIRGEPSEARSLIFSRTYDEGTTDIGILKNDRKLLIPLISRCGEAQPPPPELYDLAADPGERAPLGVASDSSANPLSQELLSWYESVADGPLRQTREVPLDGAARERLEALGYLPPEKKEHE